MYTNLLFADEVLQQFWREMQLSITVTCNDAPNAIEQHESLLQHQMNAIYLPFPLESSFNRLSEADCIPRVAVGC